MRSRMVTQVTSPGLWLVNAHSWSDLLKDLKVLKVTSEPRQPDVAKCRDAFGWKETLRSEHLAATPT